MRDTQNNLDGTELCIPKMKTIDVIDFQIRRSHELTASPIRDTSPVREFVNCSDINCGVSTVIIQFMSYIV